MAPGTSDRNHPAHLGTEDALLDVGGAVGVPSLLRDVFHELFGETSGGGCRVQHHLELRHLRFGATLDLRRPLQDDRQHLLRLVDLEREAHVRHGRDDEGTQINPDDRVIVEVYLLRVEGAVSPPVHLAGRLRSIEFIDAGFDVCGVNPIRNVDIDVFGRLNVRRLALENHDCSFSVNP